MTTDSKNLSLRDPSEAALIGALAGEGDFGSEFGDDFGADDFGGDDFGADDFGMDDFGAEVPKNAAEARQLAAKAQSAISQARSVASKAKAAVAKAGRRADLLNPNQGSSVKVERYYMSLTAASVPVFGAASVVLFSDTPKVRIRPQRIVCNAPAAGVATISDIQVANVSVAIGNGPTDAFVFSPLAVGTATDLPNIDPSQRITVSTNWTTYTPPGYSPGASFPLTLTLIGPALMVGRN